MTQEILRRTSDPTRLFSRGSRVARMVQSTVRVPASAILFAAAALAQGCVSAEKAHVSSSESAETAKGLTDHRACHDSRESRTVAAKLATPNIVLVYFDDMGWGDIPEFSVADADRLPYTREMPNFARLAREGTAFRRFYTAQPVCSASRAALLTGCYPNRIGIFGALFPDANIGIAAEERTLAEMLRAQGYATLIAGKWHLGHLPEFNPLHHGFDEYLGIPYSNDMWKPRFPNREFPELPLMDGFNVAGYVRDLNDQATLTKQCTARAVDFIERNGQAGRPFFAYLAHPQPHTPLAVSPEFSPQTRRELYGAVMRELDASLGAVLDALDRVGVADDTIVLVTSDNGPWLSFGTDAGSTGGLREGKGTTFEGGVRVPCLLRWPNEVPAGAVSEVPWMTIDVFATLAEVVGAPAASVDRPIDGRDARKIWRSDPSAQPTQETFLFYYHDNRLEAVMEGDWKLCLPHRSRTLDGKPGGVDGRETPYVERDVPLALYNLALDPRESRDVAAAHPEVVARLMKAVLRAREDLGDANVGAKGAHRRPAGRVTPPAQPSPAQS
ncbi:MAG: hypothetical protein RIR10_2077 [Planctomycetota bacterium]